MSSVHISSQNKIKINKIIDSAKERGSKILVYDALRILKLAGASVVDSFLALNSQEIIVFASQIEPPIVLKKIEYDKLPDSGIETYMDIKTAIEALDIALKDKELIEGTCFLIQEKAPKDLKLKVICDENELRLEDVKNGSQIILPPDLNIEKLISQKDTLKTFLSSSTNADNYDIKALGMLLLIISSIKMSFETIAKIEVTSFYLYREGLGYIITDAFIFLK
ncbi:MAG: hypothetical protein N2746_05235 [Deltaproteobacteria bacterium]|nr:hypothetical protein [Deltaproteobacteria bacterium]